MAEMLEHGLLRESAFRSKECDLQRLFLCQAGRHDFAEQASDLLVAQRSLVAFDSLTQHLRLSLRSIELGSRQALCDFRRADLLFAVRPFIQQFVDALV